MLQLGFVVILALLWMFTLTNFGGADFLRVTVWQYGYSVIRTQDILIGLAILGVAVTTRGPLALTAVALFCVWLLTLFGVPQLFGVEIAPVIVIMIVVGVCVHIVTQRDH
jgi:hypothetical protein